MHETDLQRVVNELHAMRERFESPTTAAGPHLSDVDRGAFKRLMLEAKSMLDADLGRSNDFGMPLLRMTGLPSYGAFNPPSPAELEEAIGLVEGGLNQIGRIQGRSGASAQRVSSAQKEPYVALSRISELQSLRGAKWDPSRLVRMLRELNLAHANGMDMATAMLVRAVTDHVPPIFGKKTFAEVAAQHSGGAAGDGRSFKGSMSHLTDSMKHIADGILHVHIRGKETLPNSNQVDFRQSLDVLLAEAVRLLR